ncbi:MAG: hypothetical protein C4295_03680 [Candidatus Fervidibacterota bacterium]
MPVKFWRHRFSQGRLKLSEKSPKRRQRTPLLWLSGKDSVEVLGYAGAFRCPEITATFVQRLGDALWR